MIYAQTVSENTSQTICQLCRQNNLWQHEKYLSPCLYYLLYQMDIDLGFTAACYTMQQAHIMLFPGSFYFIFGSRLIFAKRLNNQLCRQVLLRYSSYRLLIQFQNTFLAESLQYTRCTCGVFNQFLFCDFF